MGQSIHLSPPKVHNPVYDCAEVVMVSGFTAGATVEVYANGSELIGSAKPYIGWWHIRTNRPLTTSDLLTAIQKVGGDESFPTPKPVSVENLPGSRIDPLSAPQVSEPIYHCQQTVEATAVLSGAWAEVKEKPTDDAPLLGRGTTPTDRVHLRTPLLNEGQELYARQVVCRSNKSHFTQKVLVQPLPSKLATPSVPKESLVVDSKVVLVTGLVTGAEVKVFAEDRQIAGGIATSGNTIFPTTEEIKPKPTKYWAEQSLCELESDPPPDGGTEALTTLPEPQIRVPICPGSSSVVIENTVLGAVVKVYVNGQQWGQVTATGKETLIQLGDKNHFTSNDLVMATQEIGRIGPMKSATETVSPAGARGEPMILGGHPFFAAAPGEQPIPGPVFLRGRRTSAGAGPVFRIVACGAERIDLKISRPAQSSFSVKLVEGPGGHYTGVWDWSSTTATPSTSIMVGKHIARFTVAGSSGTWTKELPFFVIFDPAEVSAPQRFIFDHTGVWFAIGYGRLAAKSYTLHLSDNRVFGWAMDVIGGQTNQWKAAEMLLQAEHQKFNYTENALEQDVLDLLKKGIAQCSDDANMLTALLRASGIPAHPVTADARSEFSPSLWFFDTWVEARLTGSSGERWYALHSHQKHGTGIGPHTRKFAGSGWGVASRSDNDMIVMAGANWISSELDDSAFEVEYDWNTPCKRPSKSSVKAAPWIENLTDNRLDRYWSKPFWECSPDYVTPINITLASGSFRAGDILSGTVEIHSDLEQESIGELSLMLAESKPETKVFADRLSSIMTHEIRQPSDDRESIKIPFQVRLPSTISADDEIMVVANLSDARAVAYVDVAPSFDLEPKIPPKVQVGETFPLQIEVTNRLDRPLIGAVVKIELPFACTVEKPRSTRVEENSINLDFQSLPAIKPGATASVEWLLRAVSPATSAAIRINATAPDFGERHISVATSIPDVRSRDYTEPVAPPTYASEDDR